MPENGVLIELGMIISIHVPNSGLGAMKLQPNTVHIWTLLLGKQKVASGELRSVLCASERERLAKFTREEDQIRFAETRMFLRSTIGQYTGEEPRNVRFSYGHKGKPVLVDHPWLKFNLSHTLDYAAIAVTRDCHVGVDLESVHRKVTNLSRLAARKLATSEWERIKSCDESSRTVQFLRAWTRKEAFIKATGEGLSRDLKTVEVRNGQARKCSQSPGPAKEKLALRKCFCSRNPDPRMTSFVSSGFTGGQLQILAGFAGWVPEKGRGLESLLVQSLPGCSRSDCY